MGSIALVDPPRDEVVRIALAPGGLRLTTTVALAFGRRARSLASSDSPVREKTTSYKIDTGAFRFVGPSISFAPFAGFPTSLPLRILAWLTSTPPLRHFSRTRKLMPIPTNLLVARPDAPRAAGSMLPADTCYEP